MRRRVIQIGKRRVHFRTAGSGPALLLVHQSPRSSAEYEPLIHDWSRFFTCIAPDTPGYGQSDPLPIEDPSIGDFADALLDFLDAIGIDRIGGYGFHSGAVILAEAARRRAASFSALALGGYPIWTADERRLFGRHYLPSFQPAPYGEHLVWAWNRMLEQSWFFPWYQVGNDSRMSIAHADPVRVQAMLDDLLDAGDHYRKGYAAVFEAGPAIPAVGEPAPPCLISAYRGDPLHAHLDRLGALPPSWSAIGVEDRPAHHQASFDFLVAHAAPPPTLAGEAQDEGWLDVPGLGQIHWQGDRLAEKIHLHAPFGSLATRRSKGGLAVDLPGHGLSDAPPDALDLSGWSEAVVRAIASLAQHPAPVIVGEGLSALLALAVANRLGAACEAIDAHIPLPEASAAFVQAHQPLGPDRFGSHLVAGWARVRAETFFWPWYSACGDHQIPFDPGDAAPDRLSRRHHDLVRARSGPMLCQALLSADRALLLAGPARLGAWHVADWARHRPDVWKVIKEDPR